MKKLKRINTIILIVLMTAVLLMTLAACGDTYRINLFGEEYEITLGNKSTEDVGGNSSGGASATDTAGVSASQGQSSQGQSSQGGGNSAGGNSAENSASQSGGNSSGGGQPSGNTNLVSYAAVSESAYVIWKETSVSSAKAYYKKSSDSSYTQVDSELIRQTESGKARVDILGLAAGNYDIKIDVGSSNEDVILQDVAVTAYDRSGYAHFNYTAGVGAYNDDGTLKSNAVVAYVTEATKNTVTANGKTGITKIMASATNKPVVIRIIGQVASDTRTSASKYEGKYTLIDGLSEKANSGDGTLWGQMSVEGIKNLTLEGVGDDAAIYQWGITFKRCNSIEVRNLTFSDYPEDACAIDGGSNSEATSYAHFWIHNNVFNVGKRLFDDSTDKDKSEGDGAIDIKFCHNATYSYNKVVGCHKTGLVGGSNDNLQWNITYHHNYFLNNQSRMPLGRQANMHYYNNYYYGTTNTNMDLRAGAYVLSEGNYFEKCKNPAKCASGTAVKSFGDVFSSCSGTNNATIVTDRTKTVSNSCSYGQNFDTDVGAFYYDTGKKMSKVTYLSTANQAKTDCVDLAGPCKANKLS